MLEITSSNKFLCIYLCPICVYLWLVFAFLRGNQKPPAMRRTLHFTPTSPTRLETDFCEASVGD